MSVRIVHTENAPAAIGPYSQAVVAGNFLFTAGQIALDPATGQIVQGDVSAQTERVMVARYPEDWDVGLHEVGERGENSERRSRDDGSPLEPELEQVPVDDERPRAAAQMAQE